MSALFGNNNRQQHPLTIDTSNDREVVARMKDLMTGKPNQFTAGQIYMLTAAFVPAALREIERLTALSTPLPSNKQGNAALRAVVEGFEWPDDMEDVIAMFLEEDSVQLNLKPLAEYMLSAGLIARVPNASKNRMLFARTNKFKAFADTWRRFFYG